MNFHDINKVEQALKSSVLDDNEDDNWRKLLFEKNHIMEQRH